MVSRFLVASATFYALVLLGSSATAFDSSFIDLATTAPDHHVIGAEASDGAGRALATGDFNDDGVEDLAVGASSADGPANGRLTAGEVYVLFGPVAATTDLLSATPGYTVLGAAASNALGWSLAAGDVNNDGIDDLAMGATGNNTTYVVFGSPSLSGTLDLLSTAPGVTLTNSGGDSLAIGDISADGIPDLAIGLSPSEVNVIYGSSSLTGTINVTTTRDLEVTGGDGLGTAIAIADLNGDGRGDLAATQPQADGPGASPTIRNGRAHVIFGSPTLGSTLNLTTTLAGLTVYGADGDMPGPGSQPPDELGTDVAVGDFDGDGFADLLVSANLADGVANAEQDVGETYLIRGSPGLGGTKDLALAQYDLLIYGADVMDRSGERLHLADYNGDGNADITIEGGTSAGEVNVLYGSDLLTGTIDLSNYSNFTAIGAQSGDGLGDDLVSIDANSDGARDLVVSALGADGPAEARPATGEVYVVYGACPGVCASGPDTDGDGVPNALDSCPSEAEDADGFQSADGCPDPDNDADGVCDSGQTATSCTGSDSGKYCFDPAGTLSCATSDCRSVSEDIDAFHDADGCPEPDNDNDGFTDATDDCPGTDAHTGPDGMFGSPQDANHNGVRDGAEPVHTLDDVGPALKFEDQDGVLDTDGCHDSPGDDYDGDGFTDDAEVFTYLTLPYNPDTDTDTHLDGADNCPNWPNATQTLPNWPVPANDSDCDGFTQAREGTIGTNPTKHCAASAGLNNEPPPDVWGVDFNDDQRVTILDVSVYGAVFGTNTSSPNWNVRYDLAPSGAITIIDVGVFSQYFGKACA